MPQHAITCCAPQPNPASLQRCAPFTHRARLFTRTQRCRSVQRTIAHSPSAASGDKASAAPSPAADLLQRVLATHSLADSSTLLAAAALTGVLLLGAVEPAAAAHAGGHEAQLLGDVSENADFWGNVLRYVSYFFSVLLGTAYIAVRPILELMKKPTTAVLVLGGLAGLVYFVSFTVQVRLRAAHPVWLAACCWLR